MYTKLFTFLQICIGQYGTNDYSEREKRRRKNTVGFSELKIIAFCFYDIVYFQQ